MQNAVLTMPTYSVARPADSTDLVALRLSHSDHSLLLQVSPWIIVIAVLLFIAYLIKRFSHGGNGSDFEIDKAEMGLGTGKITFKPNLKDQQIAYAIWVELSTRKIGLQIDLGHDVISEIYDSWHTFFSITRELIKDIPVNKVKGKSTQQIIKLSISVLNEGLRPHLTSWQARFRHWYDRELAKSADDVDPQTIQAKFPKFEELSADLLQVNERLIKYRNKMKDLVLGASSD